MPFKRHNKYVPLNVGNGNSTHHRTPDIVLPPTGKKAIQIKSPESKPADSGKQIGANVDAEIKLAAPPSEVVRAPLVASSAKSSVSTSNDNDDSSPDENTPITEVDFNQIIDDVDQILANSRSAPSTEPSRLVQFKSKLNIYARKHVPFWLKAVNESYAVEIDAPSLNRINYDTYRATFGGSSLLPPITTVELTAPNPCPVYYENPHPSCYQQYWHERLQNEYAAQDIQLTGYALYSVSVDPHDARLFLYRIKIPGLRENAPRIDLGDVVLIRPLIPVLQDAITREAEWWNQNRQGFAPGFTGQQHNAIVWSIQRRDRTIIVKLGGALPQDSKCNVIIPLQKSKCAPAWRAVSLAAPSPISDANDTAKIWLKAMLFPEPDDGVLQEKLSKGTFDLKWIDSELNFEQKRAVQAVVDADYGQIPYLISGPPGTGKSKTITEIALQLLVASSKVKPHLLVCAPSDAAADTLLVRLSESLSPQELFRLNNWTRSVSEVPGEVRPYCYIDSNQLHSLPNFETLMSKNIVVTTCRDANMLINAGLTNQDLGIMSSRLLRAVAPAIIDTANLIHWTALLLDEAAQATEPEVLVPLSVVTPATISSSSIMSQPQFVLAGDEHQLGPLLASKTIPHSEIPTNSAGLEISLFQRLFERPLYARHPLSRANGAPPLKSSMLPIIRPPFQNLIRNYRSHPAILSTSSQLFYLDTLIPERPETSPSILSWPRWPSAGKGSLTWPVLFYNNTGADTVESVTEGDGTGAGSLLNQAEANIVLDLVTSLLDHVNNNSNNSSTPTSLHEDEIIVLSPFNAQVKHLRTIFRASSLHQIRIGPLEAFQGLESRVVVFCTTRTRLGQPPHHSPQNFVVEDQKRGLGVIDEPKRFNVAMTRAKEALIVVGNAETLTCTRDRCWLAFLEFCGRNALFSVERTGWFGRGVNRQGRELGVGKLERALRYSEGLMGRKLDEEEEVERSEGVNGGEGEQGTAGFKLQGNMCDLDEMMRRAEIELFEDDDEEQVEVEDEVEELVEGVGGGDRYDEENGSHIH